MAYLTLDVLIIRVDVWHIADEVKLDQASNIIFLVNAIRGNVVVALLYSYCC